MNCTETKTRLHQYLDGDLSAQTQQQFEHHINCCDACTHELNATRELRRALTNLPVESPRAGFEQRVLAEVQSHYAEQKHHGFVTGFASAVAAGLMLWVASLVFFQNGSPDTSMVTLVVYQEHSVRLMFDAAGDMDQVTLNLELPEHVELAGYPGKSQLNWQTHLQKGQNILTLPLRAVSQGKGELIAQLKYGDRSKTFRILMKTSNDGAVNYLIQDLSLV